MKVELESPKTEQELVQYAKRIAETTGNQPFIEALLRDRQGWEAGYTNLLRSVDEKTMSTPGTYKELKHLVNLLEPLERDGTLQVPGLGTLNGARAALKESLGEFLCTVTHTHGPLVFHLVDQGRRPELFRLIGRDVYVFVKVK